VVRQVAFSIALTQIIHFENYERQGKISSVVLPKYKSPLLLEMDIIY
jgi:hypothetical protein